MVTCISQKLYNRKELYIKKQQGKPQKDKPPFEEKEKAKAIQQKGDNKRSLKENKERKSSV